MSGAMMKLVKPSSVSEKVTRTTMDTIELSPKLVAAWKLPPFQREFKNNNKVIHLAEDLKRNGGVLPGVLTIGILDGDAYFVDGQHRGKAFLNSALLVGYADVRTHWFESMADMAREYVQLNSALVKMRPDDILRGLEPSSVALRRIREKCGFIGYDVVRHSSRGPILSMSVFIRTWGASRVDVPTQPPAIPALEAMDEVETTNAIEFVSYCVAAWHRYPEYARLWGALNLTLCAWLYRRSVLGERLSSASRLTRLSGDLFRKCLTALSADGSYLEYLVGRNLGDRDRSPCYDRIKKIFQMRYLLETKQSLKTPAPPWAHP